MSLAISSVQNNIPPEWTDVIRNKGTLSDSEETSVCGLDSDSKIKPEVELKEETENFVYKADFRGHLQLVSLGESEISSDCLNQSDSNGQWQDVNSSVPSSISRQITLSWQEESDDSKTIQMYQKYKNGSDSSAERTYYIKEEPPETNSQNCSFDQPTPDYEYSSDPTWTPETDASTKPTNRNKTRKHVVLLTQAEKKRLYRLRIKAENPAMWSSIKQKEAARKKEQREKRRQVILEMQKAMELSGLPESPDVINQKLYLEALKESYPDIWDQLSNALPATQIRNEQVYNRRTCKSRRHSPKPARMYKDVIEAQKKRVYRQRMKEERPEMYERQKARDAYARSIQRLMLKKKRTSEKNGYDFESILPDDTDKKLTYLQNVRMEDDNYADSNFFPLHLMSHMNNQNNSGTETNPSTEVSVTELQISATGNLSPVADGSHIKSDPSQACDISMKTSNHSENSPIYILSDIADEEKKIESCESLQTNLSSTLCSTQSDILWYWNDVKNNQYSGKLLTDAHIPDGWIKRPKVLTEEERLQKILKERKHLQEKRKRYRMNMTPEQRIEFREAERERLKAYRIKKKASEMTEIYDASTVCIDQ